MIAVSPSSLSTSACEASLGAGSASNCGWASANASSPASSSAMLAASGGGGASPDSRGDALHARRKEASETDRRRRTGYPKG